MNVFKMRLNPSLVIICLLTSVFATSAKSLSDCFLLPSVDEKELSTPISDEIFLKNIFSEFGDTEEKFFIESIENTIPRMHNAQSVLNDLIITIKVIDEKFHGQVRKDAIAYAVRVFSAPQYVDFFAPSSSSQVAKDFHDFILDNYDEFGDIVDYHVRGYLYSYFYSPCPSGSPYYFFYRVKATMVFKSSPTQSSFDQGDIISDLGMRILVGSNPIIKKSYRSHEGYRPSVRITSLPCPNEIASRLSEYFIYDGIGERWVKAQYPGSPYDWLGGGYSDFSYVDSGMWKIQTVETFKEFVEGNERKFLADLDVLRTGLELPIPDPKECGE